MNNNFHYKLVRPDNPLADFVYSFSSLQNISDITEGVIIPNGRIDLIFFKTTGQSVSHFAVGFGNKTQTDAQATYFNFFCH